MATVNLSESFTNSITNAGMVEALRNVIQGRNNGFVIGPTDLITLAALPAPPPYIDTLPSFLQPIEKNINVVAKDTVNSVRNRLSGQLTQYSSRLYETMLSEAAELLNRCESYRRDANDNAAKAIGISFDLVMREVLRANQQSLLKLNGDASDTASTTRVTGLTTASTSFGQADPLSKGQAALAKTEADFADAVKKMSIASRTVAKFAMQVEQAYDNALKSQSSTPGHALNHVEKYTKIVSFFEDDLSEAYEMLMAAELGLKSPTSTISNWVAFHPLPRDVPDPLSALIRWVRGAMRELSVKQLQDQELIVPIVIGSAGAPLGILPAGDTGAIMNAAGTADLNFTIKAENLPEGFSAFRLLSVGLCYLLPAALAENSLAATRRFSAMVQLPPQDFGGAQLTERSAKLSIGAVGVADRDGNFIEAGGPLISNASPLGDWKISIAKKGVDALTVVDRTSANMNGVILYLRMIGRMS